MNQPVSLASSTSSITAAAPGLPIAWIGAQWHADIVGRGHEGFAAEWARAHPERSARDARRRLLRDDALHAAPQPLGRLGRQQRRRPVHQELRSLGLEPVRQRLAPLLPASSSAPERVFASTRPATRSLWFRQNASAA